ncbi:hypothetical protein [Limnobacter sp.]|uniref:hypothetical protein n=1 Tax=Limnobacter sp. TaxID=2003368 RepID=UPI002586B201|nr:hypothetical protein [Limnobacter sp.]
MPSSIEMSAPAQAAMSHSDQIHAENVRQYETQMVEFNSSCFRKTAHNIGTAACVVGGLDAVVGLPVMLNKATCLVSGLAGAVGAFVCCMAGYLGREIANHPEYPNHPDHQTTYNND